MDELVVRADSQLPPNPYTVELGLYLLSTGERLAVSDNQGSPVGDHVVLGQVRLVP
jgi:hypothetical protein